MAMSKRNNNSKRSRKGTRKRPVRGTIRDLQVPVLPYRRYSTTGTQQYVAMDISNWSLETCLTVWDTADRDDSPMVSWKRFDLLVTINQVVSTCFTFRFVLMKLEDRTLASSLAPGKVVIDTPTTSNFRGLGFYLLRDQQYRFRILQDSVIVNDTSSGRDPLSRTLTFKVPQGNVAIDQDTTDGTIARGHLYFVVLTNSTTASANHTMLVEYSQEYAYNN